MKDETMQQATKAWYGKITTKPTVHGKLDELANVIRETAIAERASIVAFGKEFESNVSTLGINGVLALRMFIDAIERGDRAPPNKPHPQQSE